LLQLIKFASSVARRRLPPQGATKCRGLQGAALDVLRFFGL